ncbi:Dehydrogenase/reductase SDR family member 9 [Varanus komodoensis]|uniref:Dehydrogenase/reductase 9 n=1 Tax=Varanus komodoensis TaxID=61221 RepID=A0A8D2LWR5_VARKO|nr:dehydrogenase/reductase SDR family member 9 [Varanus komodoensis]XP_044274096.1 dehydrogenase/reductase SDR family member 9 [Varanus komodoensis]XP_044274097.1 dehydrogenase/reductase SDR family member 9 [Varanus komodoensis]XP_044274098.1 dehydrogenase/reductase SDR family member 9 [Varanus komodoensis]XP_044274099.1 dehydrogenase/reductase SDR family member 9 [Varanus komodoensis]KAF7248341.1 Dehydrogenase/reductase SDR family member 9 [Varanus komodoensis]
MKGEETEEHSLDIGMFYYVLLWSVICYFWWKWRAGDTLIDLDRGTKYVLITGCDSGFGKLAALTFDRKGFLVIACCLTETGAEELKTEASVHLQTMVLDVRDTDSIKLVEEKVKKIVGEKGLWGLINNAGIMGASAPTDWLSIEHFRAPIEINLIGLINVTLHMLPLVKKAKGRIINVTSVGGVLAICSGGYCPSKFGAEAFTDSLRQDMKPFGVTVSCIEPGLFKTELSNRNKVIKEKVDIWNNLPQDIKRQYGENYLKEDTVKKEKLVKLCQNSSLSLVVKCMEHALLSKQPRTRYSPGMDAKLLWIPLSYMPTFVQDYVLMKNKVKLAEPNTKRHPSPCSQSH